MMSMYVPAALGAALLAASQLSAAGAPLTLAARGKSAYQIVLPDAPTEAARYAAEELRRRLAAVSGADLPVVVEKEARPGPAILVGPSRRALRTRLEAQARKLGTDGVLLKTSGRDLVVLGGGDRGLIYAVITLLERYLGCRFLARDCVVTPRQDVVRLPNIDYRYAPPFMYREILQQEMLDWDYATRLRLNGGNMPLVAGPWTSGKEVTPGIVIYPFVHSAAALIPPAQYATTHPEYLGLVKGQRRAAVISGQPCWSHPDVLRISTEQVMKWIAERPDMLCVDVSQNDAWPGDSGACECERCAAIVAEEEAQHGPILRFVNAIADEVNRKHPGKFVETLAYDYSITPPKITKPRDNVIIRLCHFACYFHGIACDPLGANYRKAIDGWRAVSKNLFVWHYGVNFWHYLAPNPNLKSLVDDIRTYASHGVNGLMMQGDIQSVGGELSDLRMYLVAQLMWDPKQDPSVLRSDFCKGYYGAASTDVLEFLGVMDRLAETCEQHRPMNGWNPPDIATPAFVKESLAVLERARGKAADAVVRGRIERLMLPLWFVQLGWPDVYGVSKEEAREVLGHFARVIRAHKITTISEGGPNAEPFIARMEGLYGKASDPGSGPPN